MSLEDQHTDRKSLRAVVGRTGDWDDVARAYVSCSSTRWSIGLTHNRVTST